MSKFRTNWNHSFFIRACLLACFFATSTAAYPAGSDQVPEECLKDFYSFEFGVTVTCFRNAAREEPNNLEVRYWLSKALWVWMFDTQTDVNSDFITAVLDKKVVNNSAIAEQTRREFFRVTNESMALTKPTASTPETERLRRTALVAALHSNLGAYKLVIEDSRLSALGEIKLAMQGCEATLAIDANNGRALSILGLAHYLIGTNPWYVRMFNPFLGIQGTPSQGLAELEKGSRAGDTDAQFVLKGALVREKRYQDALSLLRELATKYPRNIPFKLQIGQIAAMLGYYDEARNAFISALQHVEQDANHDARYTGVLIRQVAKKNGINLPS